MGIRVITLLAFAAGLFAQDGRRVLPPESVHQYSGISPLSAAGDKLHTFDLAGNARVVKLSDGSLIASPAPYPEAHWDNVDNDLMWVIGLGQPNIRTWRPSTKTYTTATDYTGRFQGITTGSTTDITWDNWGAFWAPAEHTLCAVDLGAKKTYCVDVNAPDPVNHLPLVSPNVDYVAMTPRDSKSGLHYVLMMATPAMGVFSVDETAGVLRWVVRPEVVFPLMGANRQPQNSDGNCDPAEPCLTTPHGDIYTAPDGQVYFQTGAGIEDGLGICESGQGMLRVNAGLKMSRPENLSGVTGGGFKYIGPDFKCGGPVWSSQHTGCARWGGRCLISFDTPAPTPGQTTIAKKNELWVIGLDTNNQIVYQRIGATSPAFVNANSDANLNYWSSSRAALSMDGSQVIYDSDAGSNGVHHAVYQLASGLTAGKRPTAATVPVVTQAPPPFFTPDEWRVLKTWADWMLANHQ